MTRKQIDIRMFWIAAMGLAAVLGGCGGPAPEKKAPSAKAAAGIEVTQDFWRIWGDGKAELAAYDLRTPRYREIRKGVAVTIFVTEPFLLGLRVKADSMGSPGEKAAVMKLNRMEDFPTGIYDYNLMTSVFVAMEQAGRQPAGTPLKVTFSSQEWCGHVWHQLLIDPGRMREVAHSYFETEADSNSSLDYPPGGLIEDAILLWARGMAAPALKAGETKEAPFLPSLKSSRLDHRPLSWMTAKLSRQELKQPVQTPAGKFAVEEFSVESSDGVVRTVFVEKAPPHRIVHWESSTGDQAQLLGSDRTEYWKQNAEGAQAALKKLGLTPRPMRTP